MTEFAHASPARRRIAVDRLGAVAGVAILVGLGAGPFVTLRPNRILDGAPVRLLEALPPALGAVTTAGVLLAALLCLLRTAPTPRLGAASGALALLVLAAGRSPAYLTAPGDLFARVGPGWGFWIAALSLAVLATDALTRMRLTPAARLAALAIACALAAVLIGSGTLDQLSILREYASRADAFWAEARTHVALSLGSVAAAIAIGAPIGLVAHLRPRLGAPLLGAIAAAQSIPSIALFGLLIAPLGWAAAHLPGAAAVGIAGVGAAPAFLALTLYGLLPVAASVRSGLGGAPRDVIEAARAAGMTERQLLVGIKAPLALPALLAGLRVLVVQTVGLATVAALIGAGGFGTFVFQGVGQTAIDLVLLGAAPTVALALIASVALDAGADAAAAAGRLR